MVNRYVIVALDKGNGDVYIAPEMLQKSYTMAEAEQFLLAFSKTLKESREFIILPFEQAVGLWTYEQNASERKTDRTLH